MTIKKNGVLKGLKEVDFVCEFCDCEFSAEKRELDFEVHFGDSSRDLYVVAECPECHFWVRKSLKNS